MSSASHGHFIISETSCQSSFNDQLYTQNNKQQPNQTPFKNLQFLTVLQVQLKQNEKDLTKKSDSASSKPGCRCNL